jgi:hypothetical protein
MTRPLRYRNLKVEIGRHYYPAPILRQMPRHWTLEESKKPAARWWQRPGTWVAVTVVLAWVFAIAQTFADYVK